jgi:Protein of unknown function (DUF4065)
MAKPMYFNRGKFKELVIYLCAAAEQAGDEGFGMVKLNKLLYRADFEAYRLLGHSVTGETYEKQEYGPVARDLPIVLMSLRLPGGYAGSQSREVHAPRRSRRWPRTRMQLRT